MSMSLSIVLCDRSVFVCKEPEIAEEVSQGSQTGRCCRIGLAVRAGGQPQREGLQGRTSIRLFSSSVSD